MERSSLHSTTAEEEARLRAQGLLPVTHWVPDVDTPAFRAEAHRQALAARMSPEADDDQAFIDSIGDAVWE